MSERKSSPRVCTRLAALSLVLLWPVAAVAAAEASRGNQSIVVQIAAPLDQETAVGDAGLPREQVGAIRPDSLALIVLMSVGCFTWFAAQRQVDIPMN